MDSATVFRRTALGETAFADPTALIDQRARAMLIMIDGHRPLSDFQRFASVIGDCASVAARLVELGLIEAGSVRPNVPPALSLAQLRDVRAAAARFVNDKLGTFGQKLALQLEKTANEDELRAQLQIAEGIVRELKGEKTALELRAIASLG